MKTRLFALALVLILALGCVACSAPAQAPEDAADPAAQSPEAPAAETDSAFAEHVTFTMNTTSDPPAEDDALWNYYTDKFNFTVDWVPLQYAERFDKLRIWIATDDLPDVVWIGLNDVIYSEYITWMNSGMFAEVPSLDAYPNIQAMYDQEAMLGDELCTFDGKLMSLPAMRDSASYDFMINMGIGYRADWAEKLGMRNEGDVYTWDEFMNLLQAFIEQDPGGNGAGNTYGLCTRMGYFPDILGIWQTNPTPWTFEEPGYIEMDGQYVWYPSTDRLHRGPEDRQGPLRPRHHLAGQRHRLQRDTLPRAVRRRADGRHGAEPVPGLCLPGPRRHAQGRPLPGARQGLRHRQDLQPRHGGRVLPARGRQLLVLRRLLPEGHGRAEGPLPRHAGLEPLPRGAEPGSVRPGGHGLHRE